jgi:hypothetical protein
MFNINDENIDENIGFLPAMLADPNDFDYFSKKTVISKVKEGIENTKNFLKNFKNDKNNKLFDVNTHEEVEKYKKEISKLQYDAVKWAEKYF